MINIKRFFRLNYSNEVALEAMVNSGSVACPDPNFLLSLHAGDGIVLARFNEQNQAGEVRALGFVKQVPGSHVHPEVEWIQVTESLYPNPQGMKFWRQAKPYFIFAKPVLARYRLQEMFQGHFGEAKSKNPVTSTATTPSHSDPMPAKSGIAQGDQIAHSISMCNAAKEIQTALQNRVNPEGKICFTSARGTLMGNRGCLHNEEKKIVTNSKRDAWVTCLLEFKNRSRPIMGSGHYTELFFLDEATALAAGHRPCATCRRDRYDAFIAAWSVGNGAKVLVGAVDKKLKQDRAPDACVEASTLSGYPDGTFIKEKAGSACYLIRGGNLYQWSFEGYGPAKPQATVDGKFIVLTPACTIKTLQSGYVAQIHMSAR